MPPRVFPGGLFARRSPSVRWLIGAIAITILVIVSASVTDAGRSALGWAGVDRANRPNVLVIVADDMRADSMWVMPTVNHLAERGITFTRAYATTPLCCPSRASILTGLYARHHGVMRNSPPDGGVEAFDDRSTLATWLQAAGVRTGMIGRYLNRYRDTLDIPPGWDDWFGIWDLGDQYYKYRVNDNGERLYFSTAPDDYSTRVIGREAIQFLEQHRDRPFMLMLNPRTPHEPATEDFLDVGDFKDRDIPLPPSYDEEDVSDKPRWIQRLPRLTADGREEIEEFRRRQLGSLVSLDRAIASVVEALRADGRLDHTWIIFTSDNGLMLGEHRIGITKSCPHEECARIPLVVIPPGGLSPPRVDDRLVANIDFAPTIAAIQGAEPATPVDGLDMRPLLSGEATEWRDALILEHPLKNDEDMRFFAVVTPDRKYVRYLNEEDEELYDIVADPYELTNLAADPGWAAEKARLSAQLDALLGDDGVARGP